MGEKTIPWTTTDKTVLVIFIFECIFLFGSVITWLFIMGDIFFYPSFMGGAKVITLGISLFGMKTSQCSRWVSATILWIVNVTDIIYFLVWWFLFSAILTLGCALANQSEEAVEAKEACDKLAGFYVIWIWGCLLLWVVRIVFAVIVCVWGC